MDRHQYISILEESLLGTLSDYGVDRSKFIFQQDNDSKHTSRVARECFQELGLRLLSWPANSPDLNPIEHIWVLLKYRLSQYPVPAKGVHELWDRVKEEWNKINADECRRLIESMPRRIQAVIRAKGGNTRY